MRDRAPGSRPSLWLAIVALVLLTAGCARGERAAVSSIPTLTPSSPTQAGAHTPVANPPPGTTSAPSASPIGTPTEAPFPTSTATATLVPSLTPTATPCAEPAGRMVTGTFPSAILGMDQPYRIYLPPCYETSGRLYPTLYLFHGNIHTDSHWDELGADEAADAGIASGTLPPFLIVMPFGGEIANNTSGGDRSFEGVVLHELIPFIEDRYCAWPEPAGRAIGGLSRGGYWSLEIAFRQPDMFAAVGGHSAALFTEPAGPAYNPLSTGLDPRLIGLPIYLDIADRDWLRQGVFDLHAAMEEAGIPHVWQLNIGAHEDAYWRVHVDEYLVWYASHWPADESGFPPAAGRDCGS